MGKGNRRKHKGWLAGTRGWGQACQAKSPVQTPQLPRCRYSRSPGCARGMGCYKGRLGRGTGMGRGRGGQVRPGLPAHSFICLFYVSKCQVLEPAGGVGWAGRHKVGAGRTVGTQKIRKEQGKESQWKAGEGGLGMGFWERFWGPR